MRNRSVKVIETDSLGGVSGSTIASLFGQVNQALADGPEGWRKFHGDMYLLNPPDNIPDWDKTNGGVGYDKTTKIIHGPFVMAGINARVSMSYMPRGPLCLTCMWTHNHTDIHVSCNVCVCVYIYSVLIVCVLFPCSCRCQVVRRSNALQGNAYGAPFHYMEVGGAKGIRGES